MDALLLDRYRLLKPLGEGGFAKTYLAHDQHHGDRPCVIKHLTLANPHPAAIATARRLFQAEAAVLKRLGTHDCIPALVDAFEVAGEFYLVQDYVAGVVLDEHLKAVGPYSEAEAIQLLEDVLVILTFVHGEQVIHRDIKPTNLIVRQADGKPVLIDFGAVKEITTQVYEASSEQFTISIGTQGYAAPEQMAGRPRYSSDLYGLGMTAIRALTGRSPTALPENPLTGELLWQTEAPAVSPGLVAFLQRLTHPSIYQRYSSAEAALADLRRLETLALPPAMDTSPTALTHSEDRVPQTPQSAVQGARNTSKFLRWGRRAIAPCSVFAIVLTVQSWGGWMPWEWGVYDYWVRQSAKVAKDDRLVLVEITEADLTTLQRSTPSDATLHQALQILQKYEPRVIGLDLYRDLPQGEGHADLLRSLAAANVIAIEKLANDQATAIPAPPTVSPDRIGFNDFPVDRDGVIRRALLFASPTKDPDSEARYAFSLRLALAYLKAEGITPQPSSRNPTWLTLSDTPLVPLKPHSGGYRQMDAQGYQILLRYRHPEATVARLSLSDLLAEQFPADLIRDRIVVIGTTAPSAKDVFFTPFSAQQESGFLMPGVLLHINATSQLLDIALAGERPIWTIPEAAELGWILLATALGGVGGAIAQRPRHWIGVAAIGVGILGLPLAAFILGGWVPVWPSSIAFLGATLGNQLLRGHPTPRALHSERAIVPPPPDLFRR